MIFSALTGSVTSNSLHHSSGSLKLFQIVALQKFIHLEGIASRTKLGAVCLDELLRIRPLATVFPRAPGRAKGLIGFH